MQKNGLVSILTPCYNSEKFIKKLLDSVLNQTYPLIEMIIIDDGSTDDTYNIVSSYTKKFHEKGFNLFYIFQNNKGQSSAINHGLKLIKGEFLSWPDSDDYYNSSQSIEILVSALKNSAEDVAVVRAFSNYISESSGKVIYRTKKRSKNEDLFLDLIFHKRGYWFQPSMVKTELLFNVINDKSIYTEKEAGQNLQLLLPLMHYYKAITVQKVLFNYTERSSSHSRNVTEDYPHRIKRLTSYENTIIETLNRIDKYRYAGLIKKIRFTFLIKKYLIYSKNHHKSSLQSIKNNLKTDFSEYLTLDNKINFIIDNYTFGIRLINFKTYLYRKILSLKIRVLTLLRIM